MQNCLGFLVRVLAVVDIILADAEIFKYFLGGCSFLGVVDIGVAAARIFVECLFVVVFCVIF